MSTPAQLGAKFDRLAADIGTRIPKAGLSASAALVAAALRSGADRGAPRGGSQIRVKPPRGEGADASIAVVGFGFAVLTEFGSYKHPQGWAIAPRGSTPGKARSRGKSLRGIDRKALAAARRFGYARSILGDPSTGFAAAYVTHHPPIGAKPYQQAAAASTAPAAGAAYDKAVLSSMVSIFR